MPTSITRSLLLLTLCLASCEIQPSKDTPSNKGAPPQLVGVLVDLAPADRTELVVDLAELHAELRRTDRPTDRLVLRRDFLRTWRPRLVPYGIDALYDLRTQLTTGAEYEADAKLALQQRADNGERHAPSTEDSAARRARTEGRGL